MSIWQSNSRKKLLLTSHQVSDIFEIEGINIEKRSIGFGKYGLFVLGIENLEKLNEDKLINLCKQEKCLFIQLETFKIVPSTIVFTDKIMNVNSRFFNGYYKKFIPSYTAIIDLSKSKDEILNEMKQKGRYNINLAKKKGVNVFIAEKSEKNINIFYNLMLETTLRDGFYGNSLEYYKNFLEIISESVLIFTKIEDKILSAGIFIFDKEISTYYYGASTSNKNYRNFMATYLMQWFAIEKALEIGSKYYDFLGISIPGDKESSLIGVTNFKLKFTSNIVKVSESYIWINNKFLYKLITFIRNIKNNLTFKKYFLQ